MKKIELPPRGTAPRLLLLDYPNQADEPRAALIRPGRLPIVFPSLARAVDALRMESAP